MKIASVAERVGAMIGPEGFLRRNKCIKVCSRTVTLRRPWSCVWDRTGQMARRSTPGLSGAAHGLNLITVSGVGEAVGGVSDAVGDEKTGRSGVEGTFNNDMTCDVNLTMAKTLWLRLFRTGLRVPVGRGSVVLPALRVPVLPLIAKR